MVHLEGESSNAPAAAEAAGPLARAVAGMSVSEFAVRQKVVPAEGFEPPTP